MFAPFEQTEQTLLGAGWGTDILTTSRQKIPHQHVIATSHYPRPMMLICYANPEPRNCAVVHIKELAETASPQSRSREGSPQQANCKARDIGTSMASPISLRVVNRRIGYLISLYHGIEAVVHRISGMPCRLAPPLPSELPKQQCSPVIGILQLTLPAPPIEGFLCYRGVYTKLLSIPSEYKKVGIWCWTRRAFVS
jgi:hypothetical protein